MTAIQNGWSETTLGELGRYINGRGFKKSEWSDNGRPIIRIQNLTGSNSRFNRFKGDVEDRYIVRSGDLLVSWAATLGAYIWTGEEGVLNQHIFKVESRINRRFHKYLLDHKLAELMRQTHGSGMVHITRGSFESLPVSIPDLPEQRRIVDILEDHLSRLDAAAQGLDSSARRTAALAQSITDQAIWAPETKLAPVGELLREVMRNGHSARATPGPGIRTLTLTAVTRRTFTDEFSKVTSATPERVHELWLEPGDVLVQRSNTPELVGSTAIYNGPRDWAIFPDLLIRLRADTSRVDPEYLCLAMQSERAHRALRSRAKGLAGSMPKIDQAAISSLRVPVPDPETQREIVARAADVRSVLTGLEAAILIASRRGVRLRRSLLAAAFSGRLSGRSSDLDRAEEMSSI